MDGTEIMRPEQVVRGPVFMAPQGVGRPGEPTLGGVTSKFLETHPMCLPTLTPMLRLNMCCLGSLLSSLRKERQRKKGKEEESQKGLNQRT